MMLPSFANEDTVTQSSVICQDQRASECQSQDLKPGSLTLVKVCSVSNNGVLSDMHGNPPYGFTQKNVFLLNLVDILSF
jgi:hypothetical protein